MASKKKKVVTKDDLRRLMKETQSSGKSSSRKIDHPLAKYNSLDQLVCVLCNSVIKSELLWPTHLHSKTHKEKLDQLKKKQTVESSTGKRKLTEDSNTVATKKIKENSNGSSSNSGGLPSDFFDSSKGSSSKKSKSSVTNSTKPLLSGYGSSDSEENEERSSATTSSSSTLAVVSGLPADFFDSNVTPSTSKEEEDKPSKISDALPEGFFDDPKMDAKIRNVEYIDKMEEEWDLFQRTMKEESHVSEAIIEEEDEQVNVDRNIDEIDEQIQCWKEVNDLETKKEEIMRNGPIECKKDNDSDDDLNEEMLDEFLDWRSKKSWR
ncbi:hypothetical protein ACF0H5_003423 [Mactra antiquata]